MKGKIALRILFLCFALSFLSSCGFQLRGEMPLSAPLKKLYIRTDDPYGSLTHNLRQYLKLSNVELTETPEEAWTILHIISEVQSRQLLSVSGTQETRQYNLTLSVTFELTNSRGTVLMSPLTLNENRTFTTSSDQILGGTNEQAVMYNQMELDLVYDIMNRLSSKDVTHLLIKNHETKN